MPELARRATAFGILVGVFVVASVGTFFAARALFAPEAAGAAPGIPRSTVLAASARKPQSYHPEHADHVATLLRPAIVTISKPERIGLGESGRITLTIEHDRTGASKAPFPRTASRLTPTETKKSDGGEIIVYHAQAGDRITAHLYDSSADAPLPSREENPLVVAAPNWPTWTWHIAGSEPGERSLDLEMFANYTFASSPESWPLGTIHVAMPVDPTLVQWIKYYFAQIHAAWDYLAGAIGGLAGVAAAIPLLLKWFPFKRSRKGVPDAQAEA